jgi:PAS domain S-box-containing protein
MCLPNHGRRWFTRLRMADRGVRSDRQRRRWSAGDVQEALVISGEIPLWLVDGDDRIAFVNDAAVRILGFDSDDELLGRPSHDSIHYKHPDGSPYPAEDCPITHATRRGEPIRIERDWWVRKDGSLVPISIHCVPLEIDGRMGTAMTFHDLTASVQAEDERRRFEVERARLGEVRASRARIVEAADEQRRRVVRDLHDGAQQRLVHTVITLKMARRALDNEDEPGLALLDEALGQAERATVELRDLAHGILPAVLARGGLRAGVDALAARMPVPVENGVAVGRLPDAVEATAYFVVAEALTNVAKHARAERATVMARILDGTLAVQVIDDGVGGARPDGSGLVGLADRLATLDGTLTVSSQPEDGTHIRAEIPLSTGTTTTTATEVAAPRHEVRRRA